MKTISKTALLLGALLISAPGHSEFQPPTATELFQARATCAKLGEQIMEARVSTQNKLEIAGLVVAHPRRYERSRYNPTDGHCYVDFTMQCDSACQSHSSDSTSFDRQLIDGQTGEVLAFATIIKGTKVGMVYNQRFTYDDANSYIDSFMRIDSSRRQQ